MKKLHFLATFAIAIASTAPSMLSAQAACGQTFGSAPSATFGSPTSSIPNNAVAINNCETDLQLYLTATPRFDNPALTNNGAGVFTAQAGQDGSASAVPGYAKWNFGFDIQGDNVGLYDYVLSYDFNPGTGNGTGALYIPFLYPYANSYNLGMSFLTDPSPFFLPFTIGVAPTDGPFDNNAVGEYDFDLIAYQGGIEKARVSMLVNTVGTVVPEPSTYALMFAGLALVGVAARRRKLSV